jgi:hypothetical protein
VCAGTTPFGILKDRVEEANLDWRPAFERWREERHEPYGRQTWYNATGSLKIHPPSDLPPAVYSHLAGGSERKDGPQLCRNYPTIADALDDLFAAWVAAVGDGWNPWED